MADRGIRDRSHKAGVYFLFAELTRRGYDVSSNDIGRNAGIPVRFAKGKDFKVICKSTDKLGQSWLVKYVKTSDRLFFVLVCAETESPFKGPIFWILSSHAMEAIYRKHMGAEERSKQMNVVPDHVSDHLGKWDILRG